MPAIKNVIWSGIWLFNSILHLVYLPAYSPNLNLIERLWKWVKKRALYGQYYENFDDFKNAIHKAIDKANQEEKKSIESLMTLRFQFF